MPEGGALVKSGRLVRLTVSDPGAGLGIRNVLMKPFDVGVLITIVAACFRPAAEASGPAETRFSRTERTGLQVGNHGVGHRLGTHGRFAESDVAGASTARDGLLHSRLDT